MPSSAYPKGYKLGPDNQGFLMGLKNKIQVIFTGGPRVPSGFWKWREIPKTIFMRPHGNRNVRWENTDGTAIWRTKELIELAIDDRPERTPKYVSRIQPWVRYHFALMWPLGIHWSIIWRSKDVVKYPKYQSVFGIKKLFCGYLGWIRDSDKIYKPKVYAGGNFE